MENTRVSRCSVNVGDFQILIEMSYAVIPSKKKGKIFPKRLLALINLSYICHSHMLLYSDTTSHTHIHEHTHTQITQFSQRSISRYLFQEQRKTRQRGPV